jgi:hypothetical protein
MTWRNQIQSSKYIKGVATCTGLQNTDVPTEAVCPNGDGTFSFGGGGKQMTLTTGSSQQYPSVYRGAAGSASAVYSSDKILLQKAGRTYCSELITEQNMYTVLPTNSVMVNTNGPTSANPEPSINNRDTNPYLPPFDTYYKFKTPPVPVIDQNKKHYVQYCNGCVTEATITRYGWPLWMVGSTSNDKIISNSVIYQGEQVYVAGTFRGTIHIYDGIPTQPPVAGQPTAVMNSASANLDAFLIAYDQFGKMIWFTTMQTVTGTQTTAYSIAADASGIYVTGYMDGTIRLYDRLQRDDYLTYGSIRSTLTTSSAALFIIKYNTYGFVMWSTMVNGIMPQIASAGSEIQPTLMSQVCTDGKNVYVCNSIDPATDVVIVYGSDGAAALTLTNGGNADSQQAFLVQYNAATGMTNWATRMTGGLDPLQGYPGTTSAEGLVCDANQVYISGYYNNTATFYNAVTPAAPTFNTIDVITITNGNNNGMYIAAYNKSGTSQWVNRGDISNDSFLSTGIQLTLDASGVYVAVLFPNSIGFNTVPGGGVAVYLTNSDMTKYNIGLVKYTLTGSLVWVNKILNVDDVGSIPPFDMNGFSLSSDGSSLYVTGGFGKVPIILYHSSTTNPTTSVATLSTAGGTNNTVFLIKYNLLGTAQWSTIIGRTGSYAYGYDVSANTNNIYVTGTANGSVDLYQANGLAQPTKIATSLVTSADLYTYVVKYDYAGQVIFG